MTPGDFRDAYFLLVIRDPEYSLKIPCEYNTRAFIGRTCLHVDGPRNTNACSINSRKNMHPGFFSSWKEGEVQKATGWVLRNPFKILANPNYLLMRPVAGVDSTIFYTWAQQFVQETALLRRNGNALLFVYDGYACHLTYKTLSLLK